MTLPSNTGSLETWSTVHSWIKTCSQSHDCIAQVNTKWYPTRLVESMSNETFRIIHSDSISRPAQGYMTLSHRWGSSNFIKLTTDNLSNLSRPSPVSILPKTFREALVVAQRLNIRYVWIDSLCIIQSGDNGADWQREATDMANVYTNSLCNISADYGNNESEGLFFERTPPFKPACMVYLKCNVPKARDDDVCVYENSPELLNLRNGGLCHIMCPDGWTENVLESPLNRRGWVMQERLLAPRVLHFLAGQVSWECGETLAWEKAGCGVGPDGLHIPYYKVLSQMDSYRSVRTDMDRLRSDGCHRHVDFWHQLVRRYSRFGLTNQSDKLVAISGVARRMALSTGDQYVAGLWASSMPGALGWQRGDDPAERPRHQHTRAYYSPSFSWAAADGLVFGLSGIFDKKAGLVTAFIKHRKKSLYSAVTKTGRRHKLEDQILTDHVFGPMTSPEVELQVRGILRTCHRVPGQLVPESMMDKHCFAPSKDATNSSMLLYLKRGIRMSVSYDRPGDHEDAETSNTTYYFTILEWFADAFEDRPARSAHWGANGILLKSVDPSMGRFKRIGHVWASRGIDADPNASEVGARLGNESDLPAWSYDQATGEHVFYIV